MEKSCGERDLDDWEVLPDNKSLMDFSHGSQNDVLLKELKLDANYFICPSQSFLEQQQNSEPAMEKKKSDDDDEAKGFKDIGVVTPDVESQVREEGEEKDHAGSEIKGFGFPPPRSWRPTGIGAFCAMRASAAAAAAAAASICIFILGCRQQQHQKPKIQFKIYTHEKRMKEVVQQAARLNQALSAVRGAPMTRAHISFGGSIASA
ncbi:hypothetical protein OPV22_003435 [Ensete ventricosum]|uniref:DUF6821 domain-containing protein n=1 Tax=Ensete ventricosum TaxID=4639 RepID=A0AAV8S0Q8_ENSVE|nr:hypothetical protein OPV22_003435 [Ensete ventricosum]